MAWRHLLWHHNLTFAVNYIVKNMEICPLFTCQVSERDIYYIWGYAEIKIGDILMTVLGPVGLGGVVSSISD